MLLSTWCPLCSLGLLHQITSCWGTRTLSHLSVYLQHPAQDLTQKSSLTPLSSWFYSWLSDSDITRKKLPHYPSSRQWPLCDCTHESNPVFYHGRHVLLCHECASLPCLGFSSSWCQVLLTLTLRKPPSLILSHILWVGLTPSSIPGIHLSRCMIRSFKMAVFLLSIHPLLNQTCFTHMTVRCS